MINNIFDFITLIIIGFLALRGFKRGLIEEAVKLIALGFSTVLSIKYYSVGVSLVKNFFPSAEGVQVVLGFLIVFIVIYLAFYLLGTIVKGLIQMLRLVWLDKTLGLAFGGLKGVVIMCLVIWLISVFPELTIDKQIREKSVLYPVLNRVKTDVTKIFHISDELDNIGNSIRSIFNLEVQKNE